MSLREARVEAHRRSHTVFHPVLVIGLLLAATYVVPTFATRALTIEEFEAQTQRIGWSPAIDSHHLAMDIANRVNEERKARGLLPLAWDDDLAEMARRWSEEMMVTGYRHSPADYRQLAGYHGIGENILMGFEDSGEAHVAWMESDPHRRNIMFPEYTTIGIGVVCRNDGLIWATQLLAMPDDVYPEVFPEAPPADPIVRGETGIRCGK